VNARQGAAPECSERGREGVCVLERVEEARHGLGRVAAGGVDVKPGGALGTDDAAHMRLCFFPVDDRRREGGIGRGAWTKERPDGLPQVRHARTTRAGERRVSSLLGRTAARRGVRPWKPWSHQARSWSTSGAPKRPYTGNMRAATRGRNGRDIPCARARARRQGASFISFTGFRNCVTQKF
jgi:hypothetical protein